MFHEKYTTSRKIAVGIIILAGLFGSLLMGCTKRPSEVKIGSILPLTGDAARWGETSRKAIELAAKEINSVGGVNGALVKVIYEDSQATPRLGVNAMTKLATVDKVPVVIGAVASSVTLAIAPIAEKEHVVLISPSSSAPKISEAGDYIFRNCASDIFEGEEMAEFTYSELGIRKLAILYINNDYGVGLRDVFEKTFQENGGTIALSEGFDPGATDFRTQLTKIKGVSPEAIYMPGYPAEMGRILKQARTLEVTSQFLSVVVFESPKVLEIAGDAAEGVIYSSRAYDPLGGEQIIQDFVKSYKEEYGEDPDIFAGLAYDAMKITALAIERGGINPEKIKEELYKIRDFPGVTGATTFNQQGDVIKPVRIKMVKDGKFVWYEG